MEPFMMSNRSASTPQSYHNGNIVDSHINAFQINQLDQQIIAFHQQALQRDFTFNEKLHLRDVLYSIIAPMYPMCGLYVVGSSLNGFGNDKSDLDLCLMVTNRDIDQQNDAVAVLESINRALQKARNISDNQLILAKVPILRIKFSAGHSHLTVDLNANNSVAIRNTHLLNFYSKTDFRVSPLVAVVKEWAKLRGINDANRSSFTSYSLVLMVIHYLQCGAQPPVLPSLQKLYPAVFSDSNICRLNVAAPLVPPVETRWKSDHNQCFLSYLLLGFFRYYAFDFNFDTDAISVRMGHKVERGAVARNDSPYNQLSQWHCICIEEPFTLSNTAHSVYDERIFQTIKKSFVDAYRELELNMDLSSLLDVSKFSNSITTTMSEAAGE